MTYTVSGGALNSTPSIHIGLSRAAWRVCERSLTLCSDASQVEIGAPWPSNIRISRRASRRAARLVVARFCAALGAMTDERRSHRGGRPFSASSGGRPSPTSGRKSRACPPGHRLTARRKKTRRRRRRATSLMDVADRLQQQQQQQRRQRRSDECAPFILRRRVTDRNTHACRCTPVGGVA